MSKFALDAVSASADASLEARVAALDWTTLAGELDGHGCIVLPNVLTPEKCRTISAVYRDESRFGCRNNIASLPELLEALRAALYPQLVRLANHWNERMGIAKRYPDGHAAYLKQCHRTGQTPQLLRYFPEVRKDLCKDLVSPIQVALLRIHSGKQQTIGIMFLDEK
jgi:uncharacterized protein